MGTLIVIVAVVGLLVLVAKRDKVSDWIKRSGSRSSTGASGTPTPARSARGSFRDSKVLIVVSGLVVVIGTLAICYLLGSRSGNQDNKGKGGHQAGSAVIPNTSTSKLPYGVPAEIAALIICGCESGCRQFKPGTNIPITNTERTSSASGKYQFVEAHRKEIEKLGKSLEFDLNTEEGQDKYFIYLYQKSGTKEWEADKRSVACWEPKFKAFARGEKVVITAYAPAEKFSNVTPLTHRGRTADFYGKGKKYTVRWNAGRPDQVDEDLPFPPGTQAKDILAYNFQLRSREQEAVPIKIELF